MTNVVVPLKLLAAIVGAALAACLLSLGLVRPAEAAYPGEQNGSIVFVKYNDFDSSYNLYAKKPGGPAVQLTFSGNAFDPSYTYGGDRIVYTDYGNFDFEVFAIPASGGTPEQLTHTDGLSESDPSLSPDGKTLLYTAFDTENWVNEIYTVPVAGGDPQLIAGDAYDPEWSPDGRRIAYLASGRLGGGLYTVPASGGTPTKVTDDPPSGSGLSWSPDGERIAYTDYDIDRDVWGLYTVPSDAAGSEANPQLVYETASYLGYQKPAYSPDGRYIAFVSDLEVFTIPVEGGTPKQLTYNSHGVLSPDWQPLCPCPEPPPTDATAPRVTDVSPNDRKERVSRDTSVTATFSEEMDPDTINTETVKLVKAGSGKAVEATISCKGEPCETATLDPSGRLERGTRYKAIVTTGAEDAAGNPLAERKVWSFTTGRR